jgi:propanol-preferring alcohol dehydrogenase
MPAPYPMSPGHEVIGKIVAHGSDIDKKLWPEGKKVGAGWNGGYCTRCGPCRQGDFIHCENGKVTGITKQGGHQEYLIIDETALVNVPEDAGMSDAEMAPLLCAGNTVYEALLASQAKPGDIVIIQGLGGLGHLGMSCLGRNILCIPC